MAYNKFYQTPYKKAFALGLRNNPTEEENILWLYLRNGQRKQNRFVRQKIIYGYIVDFYTHDSRVAIEVDGSQHQELAARKYDEIRRKALNKGGIYVLRFSNYEIRNNLEYVLAKIDNVLTLKGSRKFNR